MTTNILLTLIAVLLAVRIVLQLRQGKRAFEKSYCAPSDVEKRLEVSIPEPKAIDETPRCRNCRHFGKGHNRYNQRRETYVCLARPKTNGLINGYPAEVQAQQRYYATRQERRACDKYEPKNDKK